MSKAKQEEAARIRAAEAQARIDLEDATPDDQLSYEARNRKKTRARKREERRLIKIQETVYNTASREEWWELNRSKLSKEELEALIGKDDYIRALLSSMRIVNGLDEELQQMVTDHVKENGVAHLGYTLANYDIPSDWCLTKYWADPKVLAMLEQENKSTAIYVRTGLLTAFPDWRVIEFLNEKCGWNWYDAAKFVGYKISLQGQTSYGI